MPGKPPDLTRAEKLLLVLFERFPPAGDTIFKTPGDRAAQEYQAELDPDSFGRHFEKFPGLFRDVDVLDLGSGFGGRPVRFLEYGARTVVGVEVTEQQVAYARDFAARQGVADRVTFRLGTGEELPLGDASVDLVTMMDVMEHVIDPAQVLRECARVLRPGGRLALVFPPYYDLTQGSHLHGYATRLPGLNLIFSTRTLRNATRAHVERRGIEFSAYFRDVPSDKLWNQNGLTVRRFKRLASRSPLAIEWLYLMGHLQYRRLAETGTLDGRAPITYRIAQASAQLPVLQELTCSRVVAILARP